LFAAHARFSRVHGLFDCVMQMKANRNLLSDVEASDGKSDGEDPPVVYNNLHFAFDRVLPDETTIREPDYMFEPKSSFTPID